MLQHVSHETRPEDVDAVLAFWALLGFARVDVPDGLRDTSVWVQRAGTQVHLLLTDSPVVPPAGHTAVLVDDYEATLDAVRAAGHPILRRAEYWGTPRAFLTDPSGHRIEVMSSPPPG
jgi:catechol 2,3-dioxygenase-like lactoylglutathione lyase family enzyme